MYTSKEVHVKVLNHPMSAHTFKKLPAAACAFH
jgi:hypothetical protein